MGKKRELANNHIVELIDMIIDYENMNTRGNCPKSHSYGNSDCPIGEDGKKVSCEKCKDIYFEQLREKMINKYVVV